MRDKFTVRTLRTVTALLPVALLAPIAGLSCSNDNTDALPPDVKAIVFLQRTPRGDQGNVFDYQSYAGGGRLVKLSPPSANGKPTTLFPTAQTCTDLGLDASCVNAVDIMSYDINFNADTIVLSARMSSGEPYQLFSIGIDGTNAKQLTAGGNDYVYPVYLPGGKIMFMTNLNVEQFNDASSTSSQFADEYERATTAQAGTINIDGSGEMLAARNVSHRVSPAMLPDGQIVYTEWRHMGGVNDGHLRMMNTDLTGMREAFGGELSAGNPSTNSYLKARFVEKTMIQDPDGSGRQIANYQMVAIATSRDRTLQSGKLFLINLNGSEVHSTATDLTPLIPGDRNPSQAGVGRYYDAEPLGSSAPGRFLVSWSDGPVESETLALAGTNAQFGIYVFDSASKTRFPIFDDPTMWDVLPRPLRVRPEPSSTPLTPVLAAYKADTTIGALNVYDSSLANIKANLTPGSVAKVRLLEGFSGEEGGVDMFGTTEFDGQAKYGEIPVQADNSFAAVVPGNVPFHIQLIDKFGMSLANESIWISGRAGEQRFCGGCHENRTLAATLAPGIPTNVLAGAVNVVLPRAQRVDTTAFVLTGGAMTKANPIAALAATGDNAVKGVPWDMAIQPIFDAKCVSCHNGTPGAANPTYTITDNTTMVSQTFTFDLRGQKVNVMVGERATSDFTASYLSLMGLGEILSDADVTYSPAPPKQYVEPASAMNSLVVKMMNPVQRFPVNTAVRAFPGSSHAADKGYPELTADEHYLLILNIDMGGQFFFRENLNTAGSATP
jgi:Hydrazine synthase alpha subunit middle domain